MTVITGERVRLRPIVAVDRARVREILATSEVARWWGEPDRETEGLYVVEAGFPAMSSSSRGTDGTWHDGLLMDPLTGELT